MAITTPVYCTREEVKSSLDSPLTATANAQVDDAIEAASRLIEGRTNRVFYPTLGTRTFDWPDPARRGHPSWVLYLNADELISMSALSSGGVAITGALLRPDDGPPFTRIELDRSGPGAFGGSSTPQRDISITGLWGYRDDSAPAGTLTAAIASTTATTCSVSNSAAIGVGSIIKVDSERMIVTGKSMVDTTVNGTIAAQANAQTLAVASGAAFTAGEVILLDAERMLIDDIAGNNLIVKRAWDGTALAVHTGADIYAQRTLTVRRGELGTTATTHDSAAAITVLKVPAPIRRLCVAEALVELGQEQSGYARTVGSGDNLRESSGKGLVDLRKEVRITYARRARNRAV